MGDDPAAASGECGTYGKFPTIRLERSRYAADASRI
jgi:hypothetical protein